ncbi:DUF5991 domain-containing protein [Vibrio nigripulchritudo]|uniref:DUF5991 domain-containing protein n=1 Tax=Vibrio nigripulchritudo TaxID=28173 RepID=UPI00248FA61C|nr:DUF5991 domain-containing protein [Vibrio nigripulchritudo]BDU36672.1 hypothetical protein TUMSATVNIG2_11410 [Vibrio nigripulchritudo]BDU42381.1 hypothetical protein TUMSATVNIG3_11790 [Vibrio nigripulchritudo]
MNWILGILLSASFASSASVSNEWDGTYGCELDMGKSNSGLNTWSEYELKIENNSCSLTILGFQTNENIMCQSQLVDGTLNILFASYADGSFKNLYGVQVYKVNENLVQLTKENNEILTEWKSLWPGEPVSRRHKCFDKS